METFGQELGCGTSPTLGELILELSGHSLNGGTWLVTNTQRGDEGHSLVEWRRLVCYQVFDLMSNYVAYG